MKWRSNVVFPLAVVIVINVGSWAFRNSSIGNIPIPLILPLAAAVIGVLALILSLYLRGSKAELRLPEGEMFKAGPDDDAWLRAALQRISAQITIAASATTQELKKTQGYIAAMDTGIKLREAQARIVQRNQAILTTVIGLIGSWIPAALSALFSTPRGH